MSTTMTDWAGRLERWSPILFFAAGLFFISAAAIIGVNLLTNLPAPQMAGVVAPAAFAIGFVALLGLYRGLSERTPWLARAVVVLVAIGAVGHLVLAIANLGQLAGFIQDRPAWMGAFNLTRFFALAGFLVFGIVSLRTDGRARTLGLLLILVPALDIVGFGSLVAGGPEWLLVVFISGQAVVLLSIGRVLRAEGAQNERTQPVVDATP